MKSFLFIGAMSLSLQAFAVTLPAIKGTLKNAEVLVPAYLRLNISYSKVPRDISDVEGYKHFKIEKKVQISEKGEYAIEAIDLDSEVKIKDLKVMTIQSSLENANGVELENQQNLLYVNAKADLLLYQTMLSQLEIVKPEAQKTITLKLPQPENLKEYLQRIVTAQGYEADKYNWNALLTAGYEIRQYADQYARWVFQYSRTASCYSVKDPQGNPFCEKEIMLDNNSDVSGVGEYKIILEQNLGPFMNSVALPLMNTLEVSNIKLQVKDLAGKVVADIYVDHRDIPGKVNYFLNQKLPAGESLKDDIQLPDVGSKKIRVYPTK